MIKSAIKMKNLYTIMVLLCVILTACKKDKKQSTTPDNELHNVTFNTGDFVQEHIGFQTNAAKSLSTNSLKANAAPGDTTQYTMILYYLVYDASGKILHKISQKDTDTTIHFGTITDKLASGTYTVVLVAGRNSYIPRNNNVKGMYLYDANLNTAQIQYQDLSSNLQLFDETLYKKFTLTVTNTDITQNISLSHIVAKVVVEIQDAIPSNVTSIVLRFGSQSRFLNLGTGLPSVPEGTATVPADDYTPGQTNYTMTNYTINTGSPFDISITAYTGIPATTIVANKTINVTCAPNQQITLTGNLFGGSGSTSGQNSTVTADTAWNSTVLNYHF